MSAVGVSLPLDLDFAVMGMIVCLVMGEGVGRGGK